MGLQATVQTPEVVRDASLNVIGKLSDARPSARQKWCKALSVSVSAVKSLKAIIRRISLTLSVACQSSVMRRHREARCVVLCSVWWPSCVAAFRPLAVVPFVFFFFSFSCCFASSVSLSLPTLTRDLVVSHFNEKLDWLAKYNSTSRGSRGFNVTVYSKNPVTIPTNATKLQNTGREAHTYLHHIITNFHNLPDVTVFALGSTYCHHGWRRNPCKPNKFPGVKDCPGDAKVGGGCMKERRLEMTAHDKSLKCALKYGVWCPARIHVDQNHAVTTYVSKNRQNTQMNKNAQLQPAHPRPFKAWFDAHIKPWKQTWITSRYKCSNAIFAASREAITRHGIGKYQHLLSLVNNASDTEAAMYFEASWLGLFYIPSHEREKTSDLECEYDDAAFYRIEESSYNSTLTKKRRHARTHANTHEGGGDAQARSVTLEQIM